MLVVFLVSGLWHGAKWHFIAWGAINGLLVVAGQIMNPLRQRIKKMIKIDERTESVQFLKKVIVFWLITMTWVFFRNGVQGSLHIIKNMLFVTMINFFDPNLLMIAGTSTITFITIITAMTFCIVQYKRRNESYYYLLFERQPLIFQSALMALLVVCVFFSLCFSSTEVNTQFLYFQF